MNAKRLRVFTLTLMMSCLQVAGVSSAVGFNSSFGGARGLKRSDFPEKFSLLNLDTYTNFKRLFLNAPAAAPIYSKHYIAPAPWQYWSKANQIVVTTESTAPVRGTITKSDGTLLFSFTCSAGNPFVQRFSGLPKDLPIHNLNTVVNAAGLVVIADASISVNLRNIASDELGGDGNDSNIKGNASLFSFGDAGIGTSFRIGYYRNGDLAGTERPIYSIMAIENNTTIKIAGAVVTTLNAGQSYLFQRPIGTLVESSGPSVMNTSARLDAPGGCGDGAYNPIPPVSSLGSEYVIVRGEGNLIAEQTTIVATEPNTKIHVEFFDENGIQRSLQDITISTAGGFRTFNHGWINGAYNSSTNTGRFSSSRIVADKNILVFSGTGGVSSGGGCEVDVATLVPIALCAGSRKVETFKFTSYRDVSYNTNLPYFGYILTKSEDKIFLTTQGGTVNYSGADIEQIAGVGARKALGSSGLYLVRFTDVNIGKPAILSIYSSSRLTISMVQQSSEFSMSNFISRFPDKALQPSVTQADCSSATLTADPSNPGPYIWYFNGKVIEDANENTYIATKSGNYTVSSNLECGPSAQSLPLIISLCNIDRGIEKTVDIALPEKDQVVTFSLKAKNSGNSEAIGVSISDLLPSEYGYVSSSTQVGSYNAQTGVWSIGSMAAGSESTLLIKAKVLTEGTHINTAKITGQQFDSNPDNDISSASTSTVPGEIKLISIGPPDRTICINDKVEDIVYKIGGGASGAVVTGLPEGISYYYDANNKTVTIKGVPTATTATSGLEYTITTTGGIPVSKHGVIIVKGLVEMPIFSPGLTLSRCSGLGDDTYTATAKNSETITYSLSPGTAGSIERSTGTVTWAGDFTGNAIITATASGCNEISASVTVTVNSRPAALPGLTLVLCQNQVATPIAKLYNESGLIWYDNKGAIVSENYIPQTLEAGQIDFYVSRKNSNDCESEKAKVTIEIVALPAAPEIKNSNYCQGQQNIQPLTAKGVVNAIFIWYDPSGNRLDNAPTPSTSQAGEQVYFVSQKASPDGCESEKAKITIDIIALPAAPIVKNLSYCQGQQDIQPLTAKGVVNAIFTWYDASGNRLNNAPTPPTSQAGEQVYFVSQKSSPEGCESERAKITIEIIALPAAPIVENLSYCQGQQDIQPLTAKGVVNAIFNWYDASGNRLDNAPTPSTSQAGEQVYFVSQKASPDGCESEKAKITIDIIALPAAPETKNLSYCQGQQDIQPLTAKGVVNAIFTWYDASGNQLDNAPMPSTSQAGEQVYFISQKASPDGCESEKAKITIEIIALPAAPETKNLSYCQGQQDVQPLTAKGVVNAIFTWYDASGNQLDNAPTPPKSQAGEQVYFVSQKSFPDGCESEKAKITIDIIALPAAPIVKNLSYCQGQQDIQPLTAKGVVNAIFTWYDASGNRLNNAPTPSTSQAGEQVYFVSQKSFPDGCESEKAKITIDIIALPAAPIVKNLSYCQGQQDIQPLTAKGVVNAIFTWYDASGNRLNNAPTPSTSQAGEQVYFVSQKSSPDGCESEKAKITIEIVALPAAPIVKNLSYCQGQQNIQSLTAKGVVNAIFTWYDASGNRLNNAPTPSITQAGEQVYFVSQKSSPDGCESEKAKITIEIIALPAAPETKNLNYCQGQQNIQPLTAKGVVNAIFTWYDASGNPLGAAPKPSTSQAGEQEYFVSQKASPDGCESERAKITIEIIALPAAPTVKNFSYCQNEKNVEPLSLGSANGSILAWYDASGNRLDAAPTPSTAIAGIIIYYVSATSASGCEGVKTQVRININPLPEPPVVKNIKYCQNEIAQALTAIGENLKWYDEYGNFLPKTPTPSTSSTGSKNYFVTQTASSGCESARSKLVITILAKPEKPIISASGPAEICEGSSVMLSASSATFYQWFNNGNALAGENRQTLRVNKTGKYSVQTMNLLGCSSESSDVISINVISVSSKPSVTAQGKLQLCEGEAVLLKSSSVVDNQWYKDGEAIAGATGQTYLAKVAGQYSVATKSNSSCVIPVSDQVRVIVNPILPAPVINSESNLVICKGGSITLTSSASENNQWFKDGIMISGANSSTLIASSSGKYTVKNKNASGCEGPSSNAINVIEQAFAITLDANTKAISYGSKVLVNVNSNLKYKILSWSPSNLFENASATTQTFIMQKDLKIVVNAISESGCLASATLDLRADTKKDLFIPNTFTPNGDGKNDVFKVFGTGIEMVELLIYSQWGELIYKGKQQDPVWDGTFRGVMQPVGVYVYKCVIRFKDGEEMTKNGAINLLR